MYYYKENRLHGVYRYNSKNIVVYFLLSQSPSSFLSFFKKKIIIFALKAELHREKEREKDYFHSLLHSQMAKMTRAALI